MRLSHYVLGPVIGFGLLGAACTTSKQAATKPAQTIADVEQVPAGKECEHGGLRFRYADKNIQAKLVCAEIKKIIQESPVTTPEPKEAPTLEARLLPVWPGDLRLDGDSAIAMAYASHVVRIEGSLLYNHAGADTVLMPYLEEVKGDVTIGMPYADDEDAADAPLVNASLRDLRGFEALRSIGGSLTINRNASLATLDHFASLQQVGNGVVVRNNPALKTVNGFAQTKAVHGLTFENNPALVSIDGFSAVEDAAGDVHILNNPSLVDFDGLGHIRHAEDVVVRDNASLQSAAGLQSMLRIEDTLQVINNAQLTDLASLAALEQVCAEMVIRDNAVLGSKGPMEFAALHTVGDSLWIMNNVKLRQVSFPKLTFASSLVVEGNRELDSIQSPHAAYLNGARIGGLAGTPTFEQEGSMAKEQIQAFQKKHAAKK